MQNSHRNGHNSDTGGIVCGAIIFLVIYTLIIAQLALAAGRALGCAGQ